jgi:hypothetical protein
MPQPEKLNKFLTKMCFILYIIGHVLIFFLFSIFFMPFAYVYALIHKAILIFRINSEKTMTKVSEFAVFLMFGLLILLGRVFADLVIIIIRNFSEKIKHKLGEVEDLKIPSKVFLKFCQLIYDLSQDK